MKKSPLAMVKETFTDKAGLVKAVRDLAGGDMFIDRVNASTGLDHVSNAKLLRLHATLTAVKKEHGSRTQLIDAILAAEKRTKDAGFRGRLERQSTPRLYDHFKAAKKRN